MPLVEHRLCYRLACQCYCSMLIWPLRLKERHCLRKTMTCWRYASSTKSCDPSIDARGLERRIRNLNPCGSCEKSGPTAPFESTLPTRVSSEFWRVHLPSHQFAAPFWPFARVKTGPP